MAESNRSYTPARHPLTLAEESLERALISPETEQVATFPYVRGTVGNTIPAQATSIILTGTVTKNAEGQIVYTPTAPATLYESFWRLYEMKHSTGARVDSAFFNGGAIPVGPTIYQMPLHLGGGASFIWDSDAGMCIWARTGIENTGANNRTVTWHCPYADDDVQFIRQDRTAKAGTVVFSGTAVAGTGTAFTTDYAAGDFLCTEDASIPQCLEIASVTDNTNLVLVNASITSVTPYAHYKGTRLANLAIAGQAGGTFALNAGTSMILHVFYQNDSDVAGSVLVMTDALVQSGVRWFDPKNPSTVYGPTFP